MNREELKKKLRDLCGPERCYNINDFGIDDDKFCLKNENGKWIVFFSNRGVREELTPHNTEDEACRDLYNRVKKLVDYKRKNPIKKVREENELRTF